MAAAKVPSAWERRVRPLYDHIDNHRYDQAANEASKLLAKHKDAIPVIKVRTEPCSGTVHSVCHRS
jgi:hypothetical protein